MKTQVRKGLLSNFSAYVMDAYGENTFKAWLDRIKKPAMELYTQDKFAKTWYDAEEYFIEPAIALCKLTEGGRTNAAWNSGAWGVEVWLKGLIKWVFERLSVEQLLRYFLPQSVTYYYKPIKVVKISVRNGEAVIYIEGMHGSESMLAHRFGGGVEKVMQLKGCKNILVQIGTSHEMFADTTVFFITWDK